MHNQEIKYLEFEDWVLGASLDIKGRLTVSVGIEGNNNTRILNMPFHSDNTWNVALTTPEIEKR